MITNVEFILNINHKKGFSPQFIFENTAGQGSELGSTIEELGYFFRTYCKDFPIKICIDTAHCRWGWVDLSQFEETINKIQDHIGVEHIYAFHLNDAKVTLWSKLDRHASLWRGFIGREVLAPYIQRASKHDKSLIIETPKTELRAEEIECVNKIVSGDSSWIQEHDKRFMKSDILKKFQHSEE
jgi:deoxyribonuclease-4